MAYVRIRHVRCGDNCSGCPHGPYAYLAWRENGKLQEKYLGSVRRVTDIVTLGQRWGVEISVKVRAALDKAKIVLYDDRPYPRKNFKRRK